MLTKAGFVIFLLFSFGVRDAAAVHGDPLGSAVDLLIQRMDQNGDNIIQAAEMFDVYSTAQSQSGDETPSVAAMLAAMNIQQQMNQYNTAAEVLSSFLKTINDITQDIIRKAFAKADSNDDHQIEHDELR